jgi:hypothetical protein
MPTREFPKGRKYERRLMTPPTGKPQPVGARSQPEDWVNMPGKHHLTQCVGRRRRLMHQHTSTQARRFANGMNAAACGQIAGAGIVIASNQGDLYRPVLGRPAKQ